MTVAAKAGIGLLAVALLAFPLFFYLCYDRLGLSGLSLVFAALVLARICTLPGLTAGRRVLATMAAGAFVLAVVYWHSSSLLKLYPVAVSALLLGYALYTLRHPPSAIERLVRSLGRPVSDAGVVYTRGVTMVWCGYFALNGTAAAYTALAAPTAVWAWYNGMISYAVAATLFTVELAFRGIYRRRVRLSS